MKAENTYTGWLSSKKLVALKRDNIHLPFRKIVATMLIKALKEEMIEMGDKTPNKPPKKKKKVEKTVAAQPVIKTENLSVKKPK
jgi:hypothetical protein